MNEQKPKSGRGCLLWGGIAAGVLFLIILLAVITGVRALKRYANEYTDATPLTLPTVQVTDEEVSRVRERISKFREAMQSGKTVEPLIVTSDEANALIAKAVEHCAGKGLTHFVYCKYVYGKNDESPLTEFKRRNGFERVDFPRYYVPLSIAGKTALKLGIHHGWTNLIPKPVFVALVGLRRKIFSLMENKGSVETKAAA